MKKKNDIVFLNNIDDGITRLTLNDENSGNSLSEEMMTALEDKIKSLSLDKRVKVIIIDAIGSIFSSGHNLKEITNARQNDDKGETYFKNLFDQCSQLMQLIVNCPKPIIAEVDGIATAAGCQLVASCDLAISSSEARFATPGVNIGLFCSTPMVALSRNVKKKDAMKMLLTGDLIDASEAKRIGLINDFVSSDELKTNVNNLANKIAKKPSLTIETGKKAFYRQHELDLAEAYDYTSQIMSENILDHDAIEGIGSFLEKRKPNWQDS
ncbi:MAG: enoyl-CoA hydratase [Gammaproteobacteria bacterium]|tara:strand:+ start:231 stop:1034 length:804 start_codon:yes stop_codon:yes gene_type:complete